PAALDEHGAAVAAARLERREHALGDEERGPVPDERRRYGCARRAAAAAAARNRLARQFFELGVRKSLGLRREVRRDAPRRRHQHELALQLPAPLLEIRR